jgi:hypothetical protein
MKLFVYSLLIIGTMFLTGCGEKPPSESNNLTNRGITQPSTGSLEDILTHVRALPNDQDSLVIWIPGRLTSKNEPIPQDFAIAIITDQLLARRLFPHGSKEEAGGRLYTYKTEPPAVMQQK